MSDQLIGDIRAVNKWEYIEPEWDGITLPRPKPQLTCTQFELQVRKIIVTEQGLPALSEWVPITVVDEWPQSAEATKVEIIK
jgi:hypothetical protein